MARKCFTHTSHFIQGNLHAPCSAAAYLPVYEDVLWIIQDNGGCGLAFASLASLQRYNVSCPDSHIRSPGRVCLKASNLLHPSRSEDYKQHQGRGTVNCMRRSPCCAILQEGSSDDPTVEESKTNKELCMPSKIVSPERPQAGCLL